MLVNDLMKDFNNMAHSLREIWKKRSSDKMSAANLWVDVARNAYPIDGMNGLLDGLKYNMVPESRRGPFARTDF